jgi:murein L,D-transpeptidase YcbB/YkuD
MWRCRSAALCFSLLLLTGTSVAEPAVGVSDTLQDILLARAGDVQSPLEQQVLSFYLNRDFHAAWTDPADIFLVRSTLAQAWDQGLRPLDYAVRGEPGTSQFDLALTTALIRYASDVRTGRLRPSIYKDAMLPAQNFDFAPALARALARHRLVTLLDSLPPARSQYQRLVGALAFYRALASHGGWPAVTGEQQLGYRLMIEDPSLMGQVPSAPQDLQAALMRYQERNGLVPDGKLGADTLHELNVPVTMRIRQIIANMERWRWMPAEIERRRLEVNVPDQSLDLMDGDYIALHSKVIIGKKTTPTPIARTVAISVIANPAWDIPDDIAARQFLPQLKRDANYLAKRNMSLIDAPPDAAVDWRKVSGGHLPYQLREPPGPDNALGRMMFDMPNPFDVYIHDTPGKALFQKPMREFSNGCIRTEQIDRLVRLALGDDTALDDALQSGETRTLPLARALPVYLLYWTAITNEDGSVGFRPDRYGRDSLLLARLDGR